jgi:hypothetical protein
MPRPQKRARISNAGPQENPSVQENEPSEDGIEFDTENKNGFTVSYLKIGTDKEVKSAKIQSSPFAAEDPAAKSLDQHYIVHEQKEWDSLRDYKKFVSKLITLEHIG